MFQEALIECLPHRTRRVRAYLTSASVHAVALGALAWISLQAVKGIDEPPGNIIYQVGFDPPPLGDGGSESSMARTRPQRATLPRPHPRTDVFQPVRTTDTEQRETDSREVSDPSDSEQGGETGMGKAGDRTGREGGTGDRPVKEIGAQEIIYDIPSTPGLVPPVLVSRIHPAYPETARKLRLEGFVVLHAVIDTAGRVVDLRVAKSGGELLDAAAVAAVERWIYRPATLNGRVVNVSLTVTVDFKLH
jgi:protein TonB